MGQTETKQCQNCKKELVIEPEDFAFYDKIKVPAPSFCPDCREQRRLAFRNERALYKRKCDLCAKVVVSRVSPDKPYPMYCQKCWWSDKWDPLKYGRDYDFKRPFFEQFKELLFSTPHIAILNANTVNSEWVNQETDDKNCYLNVGGHFNEDSGYNTYELYSRDCFDNFWIFKSELCYENINCERCWRTLFSQNCFDCRDVVLSYDLRNCSNCFGCAGLRHKQYHILNKPYSKEDYQRFLEQNPISSIKNLADLKEKAKKIWLSAPHRPSFILKSVRSSGNFITESKNAKNCWNAEKVEDSAYLYVVADIKDGYDCSSLGWAELVYECPHSTGLYNCKFTTFSATAGVRNRGGGSSNLEYCHSVLKGHNCFGCANARDLEYAILNKKYSKAKYQELVAKIKKQMLKNKEYGEFFPIELSPYGYNETAAQDYFPLTRQQAKEKGYPWSNYESQIKYQFSDYQIPDDIKNVKDDILDKVLKCEKSGKAYKIIPMELEFYRKIGLPIPRRSPLQRHKDRMALLPPRKLFSRKCQKCGKPIQTVYAPDRPEIVYCEKCYLNKIV